MNAGCDMQASACLARAWALLDRGEYLAREALGDQRAPGLWLLAANAIARARDAVEAIQPDAPVSAGACEQLQGTCLDLVRAANDQLASIPARHQPAGLWLAFVHLTEADHEVEGRSCS